MLFANNPRRFTRKNVEALSPNRMGCYGIYRIGLWIYVGKGDIRARLLAHLDGDVPCILNEKPQYWVDLVTDDMDNEEKRLILACDPVCNQTVG